MWLRRGGGIGMLFYDYWRLSNVYLKPSSASYTNSPIPACTSDDHVTFPASSPVPSICVVSTNAKLHSPSKINSFPHIANRTLYLLSISLCKFEMKKK